MIVLCAMWIVAGTAKLVAYEQFVEEVSSYAWVPLWSAPYVACYIPLLEITLGVSLWIAAFRIPALLLSAILLLGFSGLLLTRGADDTCGCMGRWLTVPVPAALLRNVTGAAIAAYLALHFARAQRALVAAR